MYEWKPKVFKLCIVHMHLLHFSVILFCMFSFTTSSTGPLVTGSSISSPVIADQNVVYHRHKDSNTKQDQSFEKEYKFTQKLQNLKVSSSNENNTPRAASPINPRRGKQLFPSMPGCV